MKQIFGIRKTRYISFAVIPIIIVAIFGIDDKNVDYFEKGSFTRNSEGWEYRYNNVVYPYGLMVSHWANIAILSIVGILISWIVCEAWKLSNISIKRSHFEPISHLLARTFTFCYRSFHSNPMKSKNISTVSIE